MGPNFIPKTGANHAGTHIAPAKGPDSTLAARGDKMRRTTQEPGKRKPQGIGAKADK